MAVDDQGNAFVTGFTLSSDFPTTAGAYDTSHNGSYDVFLTKLNAAGSSLLYSTYLGGSSFEGPTLVALGADGRAYLTGNTASHDFSTTPGAYQTTIQGGNDVFVARFDTAGSNLVYSTLLGSSASSEFAYGLGVAFVMKLDPALSSQTYSTYLGGWAGDSGGGTFGGHSIEVDSGGRAHVTGLTGSSDFPTTTEHGPRGGADVFVTRFDPTGSQITYSTVLGGGELETSGGIALDAVRNAYVTGRTDSSDFPIATGAYDTEHDGTSDAFVAKLLLQPRSMPGCKVSGSGRISAANGDWATLSGSLQASSDTDVKGKVQYIDHGPADRFSLRSLTIDALVCDGAHATISGLATTNGKNVDFTIDLLDAGEPGRTDTYRLQLSNGYDSGARTLAGGNVQVRSQ